MEINLFYLKYFHDAVLMGSVCESARRNFVSQSAVSQAIAKLENTLGVELCMHKKQQFKLTGEGEIVFLKAKEIFSSIRSLNDALDQYRKSPKMALNFVTTHSIGLSILPNFLHDFRKNYPNVEVNFQFGGLTQIKGWLKQGIAEFALVLLSPHFMEYSQYPLYKGNFGLYKQKNEKGSIDDLGVFVENREGLMVNEFRNAYLESYGKPMPISLELNNWEFIARYIESFGGYGLIPDLLVMGKRYPKLECLPQLSLPYTLSAVYPKGEKLSYSATTFLKLLFVVHERDSAPEGDFSQ